MNMNDVKIFESPEFGQVRTTVIDGEPWFVAADVCRALDLGNPTRALDRLDNDERTLISIKGASNGKPVNGVNEPGLYSLVLGSRKPEAKAFKRWITHEVIPAIRKTGGYHVPQSPEEQMAQTFCARSRGGRPRMVARFRRGFSPRRSCSRKRTSASRRCARRKSLRMQ